MEKRNGIWIKAAAVLLFMAAVTALLLLLGAALTYYAHLTSGTAHILITVIYILVGFSGGFFVGKLMKEKKFLWGAAEGVAYFVCLLTVSLVRNGGAISDVVQLLITFVLLTASSVIGGMVS